MNGEARDSRAPHPPDERVLAAERDLARALMVISSLRRAAVEGRYDHRVFQAAIEAYRQAEARVTALHRAVLDEAVVQAEAAGAPPAEPGAQGEQADAPAAPLEVTPRLLFARWLVQTGRLSEWKEEPEPVR